MECILLCTIVGQQLLPPLSQQAQTAGPQRVSDRHALTVSSEQDAKTLIGAQCRKTEEKTSSSTGGRCYCDRNQRIRILPRQTIESDRCLLSGRY